MITQPIGQYLTPQQLCEYLGGHLSPRTMANWRSQSQGPAYVKIGGKVLYHVASVEAWVQRRTVNGTGQYRA